MTVLRSPSASRRNTFTALAVVCLALTFLVYVTPDGMQWMMWRDSPVLAVALVLLAAVLLVLRRRAGGP